MNFSTVFSCDQPFMSFNFKLTTNKQIENTAKRLEKEKV